MKGKVYVVDGLCGIGKTCAAINKINADESETKYMYITPYLEEIQRIKQACPSKHFYEPEAYGSKLIDLKRLIRAGKNIASTHALFMHFDREVITLLQENEYVLIMDEVAEVIKLHDITEDDLQFLLSMTEPDEDGRLRMKDGKEWYKGRFDLERIKCEMGTLYYYDDSVLLWMLPEEIFRAFQSVYILTYMFDCQLQRCYFDLKGVEYEYLYVKGDCVDNYEFTSEEQRYQYPDYTDLITIIDSNQLNKEGDAAYSLSKTWYSKNERALDGLKGHLSYYYRTMLRSKTSENLWTTFKGYQPVLKGNGYAKGFLSCNARASNEYRDRTNLAYLVNYYLNPILVNYLTNAGIRVQEDAYALSQLIQWIFRSAIRDKEPIQIYIPSRRMRELLVLWSYMVSFLTPREMCEALVWEDKGERPMGKRTAARG